MTGPNPSGVKGLFGRVADAWDRLPVGGRTLTGMIVAVLAAAGGTVAAFTNGGADEGDCRRTPLIHVYRPQRLQLVASCARVTGTVLAWRHEHDGDFHVSMRMDADGWVNPVNAARQHGFTVVEFVPLMPRPERFYGGQRLELVGSKVLDNQHGGWVEMHPVFEFRDVTPPVVTPAPNRPALAPRTEDQH